MLKKLLKDLEEIDWPHRNKRRSKKTGLAKSYGLEIDFPLKKQQ